MELIEVLKLIDFLTVAATNAGVDFASFHARRDAARAEGRYLNDAELQASIDEAKAAVAAI